MIIISWDVGIVHLAYTVIRYRYIPEGNRHKFKILDWNVINLLDDETVILPCCGFYRDKSECTHNASHMLKLADNQVYGFCKLHLKQADKYWNHDCTQDLYSAYGKEKLCTFAKRDGKCCGAQAKIKYCYLNQTEYFCTSHYRGDLQKKLKQFEPQPIVNPSASKYPTNELQLKLVKRLDDYIEHFAKLGIEKVYIENQPAIKNPKMKAIASTLYDYFLIRCFIDKVHNLQVDEVSYICPNNKLMVNSQNTVEVFKKAKDAKHKYKLTKQLGIEYTYKLLQNDPEQLDYLEMFFDKKDDICDSFLQGLHRLMSTNGKKAKTVKRLGTRKGKSKKMHQTKKSAEHIIDL
jgi:hypothetical protein